MSEIESVITRGAIPVSEERREKAVLVGVDRPGASWPLASSLAELERLVDTAGADVAAVTTQKLDAPNPRTFVGSGKAEEVAELAAFLASPASDYITGEVIRIDGGMCM